MFRLNWRALSRSSGFYNPKFTGGVCENSTCSKSANYILTSPNQPVNKIESHLYCLNHVKKYDRENYLAALRIEDDLVRRGILALRAFNVELSLVRDSTTNSDRAKLRFHFWSKLVDEIVRRNNVLEASVEKLDAYYNFTPVAKELLEIFHLVDLDEHCQDKLRDLIGSRVSSKVLGYKPFEDLKDLELYCSKSNGSIYYLSVALAIQLRNCWAAKEDFSEEFNFMSESLGVAQGLMNVVRGIRYNATKNCCYIPRDLLAANQLTASDFRGDKLDQTRIKPVIVELSARSQKFVSQVYETSPDLPKSFRCLFLPCIAIQSHLKKLKRCDYNICDPSLVQRDKFLPFNLWMASNFFRTPLL